MTKKESGGYDRRMSGGWVYITTNRPNGTLYVGVTADLIRRLWEHREGLVDGFTKRYGLKRLVYFERHDDIRGAIQREKNMKHWPPHHEAFFCFPRPEEHASSDVEPHLEELRRMRRSVSKERFAASALDFSPFCSI